MYERYKKFTVMLLRIQRAIQKIKNAEVADFSLKSSHVSCLYYLYKEKSLTAKELCDICGEDKSHVSHSLHFLEENGYVVCQSDAKKRYNAPFFRTEKGSEAASHIAAKIDEIFAPAGEGISEEEREILYGGLARITENLEKVCESYDESRTESIFS